MGFPLTFRAGFGGRYFLHVLDVADGRGSGHAGGFGERTRIGQTPPYASAEKRFMPDGLGQDAAPSMNTRDRALRARLPGPAQATCRAGHDRGRADSLINGRRCRGHHGALRRYCRGTGHGDFWPVTFRALEDKILEKSSATLPGKEIS